MRREFLGKPAAVRRAEPQAVNRALDTDTERWIYADGVVIYRLVP